MEENYSISNIKSNQPDLTNGNYLGNSDNLIKFTAEYTHTKIFVFYNGDKEIGRLDFSGDKMKFSGDMEESAVKFFEYIAELFDLKISK